jgi:hypothetical protein
MSPVAKAAIALGLLAACEPEPELPPPLPSHLCATDEQVIDLAPPEGDYGDLDAGADLWCGNPPQGGAPYTPFRIRLKGPEAYEGGFVVSMTAVDLDTEETLANNEVALQPVCANVGDSAKWWVGSEAHMRYDGFALPDLADREAALTVAVAAIADGVPVVLDTWDVHLVLDL